MYEMTRNTGELRVEFSATFENVDLVCVDVKNFLAENHLQEISFDVLLGVREVLTNAVRHGSKMDKTLVVSCLLSLGPESLVVEVTDQGPGFDWRAAVEKCLIGADKISGRGICILGEYFDTHKYNEKGNKVLLVKKRPPAKN